VSTASTPAAPATAAAAGSAVKSATSVHTGEPWAGSRPLVIGALLFGAGLVGAGAWARRRQTRVPAA
jgi:MYXO-CTERM domain-containing protein